MPSALAPSNGLSPVRLRWSVSAIRVPGGQAALTPPAALVSRIRGAPSRPMSRTGWTTRPARMAFVEVQATLEADDRHARRSSPSEQPAGMARRRGRRPAGQLGERDGHRRFEPLGQAAEPGAQDDAEARDQVGARTDGRLERVQAGRQVAGVEGVGHGRQDTPRRSGPTVACKESREVRGSRGLLRPEEVSTPGCRSHPSDRSHRARPRRAARPWARKRPKRPTGRPPPPCGQLRRP